MHHHILACARGNAKARNHELPRSRAHPIVATRQGGRHRYVQQDADRLRSSPGEGSRRPVRRGYHHLPMLALILPANALEALSRNPAVESITMDAAVASASTAAKQNGTTLEMSFVGSGSSDMVTAQSDVCVDVIDSGMGSHPDLNVHSPARLPLGSSPPLRRVSLRSTSRISRRTTSASCWPRRPSCECLSTCARVALLRRVWARPARFDPYQEKRRAHGENVTDPSICSFGISSFCSAESMHLPNPAGSSCH